MQKIKPLWGRGSYLTNYKPNYEKTSINQKQLLFFDSVKVTLSKETSKRFSKYFLTQPIAQFHTIDCLNLTDKHG